MIWLDRIIFLSLCAFIFVLPASVAGVGVFSYLAAVLFVIKALLELVNGKKPDKGVLLSLGVPLFLFAVFCGASIVWSQYPPLSMKAFLGKVLIAVLTMVTVIGTVNTRARFMQLMYVFMISAGILCLDALWQLYSGYDVFKGLAMVAGRVSASMRHPNDLGAYLIFAISAGAGVMFFSWSGRKKEGQAGLLHACYALTAWVLLLVVVLGFTFSRSAWLGGIVALVVFVLFKRQYITGLLAFLVFFGVVFSPLMASTRNASLVSDNAASGVLFNKKEMSGSGRLAFWKDALKIIHDYPLAGTGLNTYTEVIKRYSSTWQAYPHNCYLQMAAEIGLAGLAVFLWLLFSVGRFVLVRMAFAKQGLLSVVMAGLFAGWIGFLVESSLDTTFYSVQLSRLMWFMMGLLLSGAIILEKEGRDQDAGKGTVEV